MKMQYEFSENDAYNFARHVQMQTRNRREELDFEKCPYCHGGGKDKWTFSINLRSGQFKCLRASCGITGNMLILARDFDFELPQQYQEYIKPKKKYRQFKKRAEPIKPKSEAIKYLESRGISESVAKKYEITVQNNDSNILVFPFYDEKGDLQFIKYRKTNFDKERDKNKEWCESGCKPILFGMKQCNLENKTLVITEGQMDSLSVIEAGIENAVSVPNGAKGFTWIPYCWDWVSSFETIIVFGDYENEHMTLLDDIKKRFKLNIKAVQPQAYRDCKDANDILRKYGKKAVKEAVLTARPLPVKHFKWLTEVEKVNIWEKEKLKTGMKKIDAFLYGGLFFGQVVILGGKRGDGKSTFGSMLLKSAIQQGYSCYAYSGELPNYIFKSWLDFQIAGPNHIIENRNYDGSPNRFITNSTSDKINAWYDEKIGIYDSEIVDLDEQENLVQNVEEVIMKLGIRVVLVDNLMTGLDLYNEPGTDKYEKQSLFVKKMVNIARKADALIILVAHRRKNSFTTDANDEISGSADITNLAGTVLSYDRDDKLEASQRKLICSKNRFTGKINTGGFVLNYDEKSKRIYMDKEELHKEVGWENIGNESQETNPVHYDWEMNVEDTPFQ